MAAFRFAPIALVVIALTLAGCTGGGGGSSSTSTSAGGGVSVGISGSGTGSMSGSASASNTGAPATAVAKDIMDNSFPDGTFTVKVGTTVTWTHKGTNPHSVSGDSFDSSPNCSTATSTLQCMKTGDTYVHKFETTGSFAYHCKIHSSMTGTVTVIS